MDQTIVSSKGQITLPSKLRAQMGLLAGTKLSVVEQGGAIVLRPIKAEVARLRGSAPGAFDDPSELRKSWDRD